MGNTHHSLKAKQFKNRSKMGEQVEGTVKLENPSANNASQCIPAPGLYEDVNGRRDILVTNIIQNHDFSGGLHCWHPNCCKAFVVSSQSTGNEGLSDKSDRRYAVITNRTQYWQGLEQDITGRVSEGSTYKVSACVAVAGPANEPIPANVQATLKLEYHDLGTKYLFVGRASVSNDHWEKLEGTFSLSAVPNRLVFYIEGPAPGVDLLIESVVISCFNPSHCYSEPVVCSSKFNEDENVILNPNFENDLNDWSGRGCSISLNSSRDNQNVVAKFGKLFASAKNRRESWNGIQQEITGRVHQKSAYEVTGIVRIFGHNVTKAKVKATLWVQTPDFREHYIGIASVQATDSDWVQLHGKFLLNVSPLKVVIFLEGPSPGTDILLNSLVVKRAQKTPHPSPPVIQNPSFGVNIVNNTNLSDGTNAWFPLGDCTLTVKVGSPLVLPPMARYSLESLEPLSGRYILATNRKQTWMGPAQLITDKLKLYLTYQVSAWVRVGTCATGQIVNVALDVDGQWVNGGQIELSDDRWHEVCGSFRLEAQPTKVMVYIQGPGTGFDLMVAGFQIFPVDRQARFRYLNMQIDKIRKRHVILNFTGSEAGSLSGSFVRVRQTHNSFPFGSCVNRTDIENEDFVDFFTKNFNWAVFGNELKWYWTEPREAILNYKDADVLLDFCASRNMSLRGHCIFWETEESVPSWVQALNNNDLMTAVQNRLTSLLPRYKGKFKHYDVNNEMLHGSFYQNGLGKDIRAKMFMISHQLDSSATLFVNDFHIEDGCDAKSSPEKYINHILDLQKQGAPVGGIGVQGHINNPVGPIVCSALDSLGSLGLPIWFTELDVCSNNEYIRADDLEVMLREGFAHPAVEGIMLWGYWELLMSRENAHLVNAEGDINEAGKRFLALKQEWLSHVNGHIDEHCQFAFRGFHGTYEVEVISANRRIFKTFTVDKGDDPLVLSINF